MGQEGCVTVFQDGLARLPDHIEKVGQVVQGVEAEGQQLLADVQMAQIGTGEGPAGVTVAGRIQGAVVLGVFLALDVDLAQRGIERAVTRVAGGQHAVEHVDTGIDAVGDVQGRAHAHEVAGLVLGQLGRHFVHEVVEHVLALAHRKAADGEPVEIVAAQFLDGALAQILEETALGDGEQQVLAAALRIGRTGAQGPARGQGQGLFRIGIVRAVGHAFVQHHHDVGIEVALDAHHALGREQMLGAVQMGTELHAFLPDLAQGAQAEDLEAAAVGEDGAGLNFIPNRSQFPTDFIF